ncbi:MAG: tRNA uridine-5-carboxymethylaminomethyl(34) synthesis GTPase MnmE [Bacteroidales bacterium]
MTFDDTICAIATPPGTGAIAIIRLCGKDVFKILDKVFQPARKKKEISGYHGNTIHFGRVVKDGEPIDEVLVSIFRAPHSYTGEDMVEISCHGSPTIQQEILQVLIINGARLARPGEYTQRAFLNGKMDLSQAEAVADLIAASSENARKLAMDQMRGGYSKEINHLRDELLQFASLIELELDFSEEEVEFADRESLNRLLDKISGHLRSLHGSFSTGNAIKNGIPVVIAGYPNVGKSTLLNILLNEEKAIVSEIPGTTRDVIEDIISLEGILFRFIDTAGLRKTGDKIESIGISRAFDQIKKARIVILVTEATRGFSEIIKEIDLLNLAPDQELIVVPNKTDKLEDIDTYINKARLSIPETSPLVPVSAKNHTNIGILKAELVNRAKRFTREGHDVIVSNVRHYEALGKTITAIDRVKEGLQNNLSGDLVAQDIREAIHFMGEITGQITTDEILENIFKNFCIGK